MSLRQVPRVSELRDLLRLQPVALRGRDRRVGSAHSIADLRATAQRRTPRAVFDYVDGAAEHELSLTRSREAFQRVEFHPAVLRDVANVDTTTTVLGRRWPVPFALAPTGFTRMMHHEGECAVVRAAERAGVTYALSTMGTTSLEDLADEARRASRWFQLYVWKDRDRTTELLKRAEVAGYEALVLTVDTPVAGARMRDVRNGLTIPPALTAATVLDAAKHPAWWFNLITTPPLSFASLNQWQGTVADLVNAMFDPTVTFDDIGWIRDSWHGRLVLKGIQRVDDARAAADLGADGLVVSNHGGRQLDRSPIPLEVLPSIVEAVGDRVDVLLDGGVLNGADIVAALALGAKGVLVGRAYLYGLMAAGEVGVARSLKILTEEIARTMQLLGVNATSELHPCHVTIRR